MNPCNETGNMGQEQEQEVGTYENGKSWTRPNPALCNRKNSLWRKTLGFCKSTSCNRGCCQGDVRGKCCRVPHTPKADLSLENSPEFDFLTGMGSFTTRLKLRRWTGVSCSLNKWSGHWGSCCAHEECSRLCLPLICLLELETQETTPRAESGHMAKKEAGLKESPKSSQLHLLPPYFQHSCNTKVICSILRLLLWPMYDHI